MPKLPLFLCAVLLTTTGHFLQAETPAVPPNKPPIVGGYSDMKVEKEVLQAAEFAVQAQTKTESSPLKLVAVTQAQIQIVAGRNYKMTLTVTQSGKTRKAQAVVYRDLKDNDKLTSWQWN